ncbi:hypothetical protein TWF696_007253 [Orbilia brochopaga]|uniref:DASH complex subunit DUO1 n=1 Tax=Orbilia brochopaga TaxID=3140254 RepID=A0AAV9UUY3_9PEZI
MDTDDSFTRDLEQSSLAPYDGPGDISGDISVDLDLDIDNLTLHADPTGGPADAKDKDGGQLANARGYISSVADEEAREAALQAELESVQRVNRLIVAVNKSLQDAMANMGTVNAAVDNANMLLDKYTQILSQSTHTSRILLNGYWQGSTADIAAIEHEAQSAALAAERRRQQEAEAAAAREREARARDAAAAATATAQATGSGTRGSSRGRSTGRKTPAGTARSVSASGQYGKTGASSSGITGGSGTATTGQTRGILRGSGLARYSSRGTSGIGRGTRGSSTGTAAGRGTRGA